jgi:hypothetical protein
MKTSHLILGTSTLFAALIVPQIIALACTTIRDPMVDGYGLDYCREWAANCGQPAADAYCQSIGYSQSIYYRWVSENQVTRVINGGQVCDAGFCDRITLVVCS